MRKIVAAFIAGLLVMASGQVLADGVSRIGKKVGAEALVYLNGTQLSDAIIVDSKSYAPVRDIAEAFGTEVTFNNEGVEKAVIDIKNTEKATWKMTKEEWEVLNQPAVLAEKQKELARKKENLTAEMEQTKKAIEYHENVLIPQIEANQREAVPGTVADTNGKKVLQEWKDLVAENKQKLIDLEAEIVEIDKQLAELESAE